jgi:protein-S-isoprenylcysteine O-methyltransferase Ste14
MRRALQQVVFVGLAALAVADAAHTCALAFSHQGLHRYLAAGYQCLFAVLVCVFALAVIRRPAATETRKQPLAVGACVVALTSVVFVNRPGSTGVGQALAGELIAVVSCAWLVAGALALGNCFGILPAARGLVTRGPFRLVRHPLYLGELGIYAGLLIASPGPLAFAGAAVFFAAQWTRMRLEEDVLRSQFGSEYAAYAERTPRLVPAVLTPPVFGTQGHLSPLSRLE